MQERTKTVFAASAVALALLATSGAVCGSSRTELESPVWAPETVEPVSAGFNAWMDTLPFGESEHHRRMREADMLSPYMDIAWERRHGAARSQVQMLRMQKLTVADETNNSLNFYARTFVHAVPATYAHLEAALAHHHRRTLQPARAILDRVAAEADVVEELEERCTRLELEELADVIGRVLQRVVARTEELRRLNGHAAALHRSRLPLNLFLCEQHVASGRRRPRLELDLGCNVEHGGGQKLLPLPSDAPSGPCGAR